MHPFHAILRDIEKAQQTKEDEYNHALDKFVQSLRCKHEFDYNRKCIYCKQRHLTIDFDQRLQEEFRIKGRALIRGKYYYSMKEYLKEYYGLTQ